MLVSLSLVAWALHEWKNGCFAALVSLHDLLGDDPLAILTSLFARQLLLEESLDQFLLEDLWHTIIILKCPERLMGTA